MEQRPPTRRGVPPRLALAVLVLLCLCGVGGIVALELSGPAPEREAEAPAAPPPVREPARPPPAPQPPAPAPHAAPSFDVVRVSPAGDAVLAGRAEPGDQVTLHDGASVVGQVTAGPGGEWVLTAPLPPGGRELTLSARDPARPAAPEVLGAAPVLVVVPDRAGGQAQTSLAVLAPTGAAPRVLQGAGSSPMGLDAVDYDEAGRIRFAGHAPPGAGVRLYVDNSPAGDARADPGGRWTLTPERPVTPGTHRLRVDQLNDRRVVARVELPFRRASLPAGSVPAGRVVVQPGENLWRIARSAYGEGTQYTVIYQANRDQIRDPAVIYPGQTFDVPRTP